MTSDIIWNFGCANCWVDRVETNKGVGAHIRLQCSYGNHVRSCFLSFGHDTEGTRGDAAWGEPNFG